MNETKTYYETLHFRKGDKLATIITDGLHYATYTNEGREWHNKLSSACAYLESKGYNIIIDLWNILK